MNETTDTADQETKEDTSPEGLAKLWGMELAAARDWLRKFHERGRNIQKRLIDERGDDSGKRLNLFAANNQTLRALLFGKTPSVDVDRRFNDSADDVARVASEMLSRILNADIQRDNDTFAMASQQALDDRLGPGVGCLCERYVTGDIQSEEVEAKTDPETGAVLADAFTNESRPDEDVETDYVYWEDMLWSAGARTWHNVRWVGFKKEMTRKALIERFGATGKLVPLTSKRADQSDEEKSKDPWKRADVWEIWSKEDRKVYWFVDGFDKVLDQKEDPLGLTGFFPFPRPLFANLTTAKLVPTADWYLAQDLYRDIDETYTRVQLLVDALRVAGAYDSGQGEALKGILDGGRKNELYPVANWAMFAEKGGLRGIIDWLPLDVIAATLEKLREHLQEQMGLLYQVTGMSDIMRGQASSQTTATEQAIKAKFASVRVQSLQDEVARFVSDAQRVKAEIICKHFDPQNIIDRSNILQTADAHLAQQAVELLQSGVESFRIEVKPESVSLTDFAALKQERTEFIGALSGFLQAAVPMAQMVPGSMQYLLQILQWVMAGFKGSSQIEGVLDAAIDSAEQAAQQPPPPQQQQQDPRLATEQFKAQAAQQHTQMELQADLVRTKAETQADIQKQAVGAHLGMMSEEAKQRADALKTMNQTIGGGQ